MTIFWALTGQALLSVTRFLTTISVGGRFAPGDGSVSGMGSPEQLGYYSSTFGILMLLIAVHEAFVTTPLTVFSQSDRSEERQKTLSGSMLTTSLLLIGVLIVCGGIYYAWLMTSQDFSQAAAAVIVVMLLIAPLQLLREFSRRWLLANLEVRPSAILEFLIAVVFVSALALAVINEKMSATAVFGFIGCVNLLALVGCWAVYRHRFRFQAADIKTTVGRNFRYGRWVAGENVCSTITLYLCIWLLAGYVSEEASGVFFACFTVVLLANPFLLGVCSILAPRSAREFHENGLEGLKLVLVQYIGLILVVLLGFSVFLWFYGEPITNLFFGSQYEDFFDRHLNGKNSITSTLGLALPFLGASFGLTCGLLAINRPQDSFYSSVVGLVAILIANFSFSEISLQSAAVSFLISVIATMASRLCFLILAFQKPDLNTDSQSTS
ncbi:hypothetical protein N9L06_02045 [Mariniblastus sp.]|nr:hypothetical protein [Mariniblastus sp.]